MRVPPAPVGGAETNRNFDITPAVDGSASWTIPGMAVGQPGCWVTLTNYSSATVRVVSGPANVASAAATDFALTAGATQEWWCNPGVTTFKFNGAATPAVSAYRSSI